LVYLLFITNVKGTFLGVVRVLRGIKKALKQLPACHTTHPRTQTTKERKETAEVRKLMGAQGLKSSEEATQTRISEVPAIP
jgi:hypothetical protein